MEQAQIKEAIEKSFAGRILETKWLELGETSILEKDNEVPVLFVEENGQSFDHVSTGNRVFPPEFLLSAKGETPEKAIESLIEKENRIVTLLLFKAVTSYAPFQSIDKYREERFHDRLVVLARNLTRSLVEDIYLKVVRSRFLVEKLIISANVVKKLKEGNTLSLEEINALDSGILGDADIIPFALDPLLLTHKHINVILAVTAGKYLGKRIIRFATFPPKDEGQNNDYIAVCQESLVIMNPFAIAGGFSEKFIQKNLKLEMFSENK